MKYSQPKDYVVTCVDAIVLNEDGEILLIRRNTKPFRESWVLPGGHLDPGEEVAEEGVAREVREETGLKIKPEKVYGVYSDPNRDPRFHTLSVVYVARVIGGQITKTIEASEVKFFPPEQLPEEIGFDHRQMIEDFINNPEGRPIKEV